MKLLYTAVTTRTSCIGFEGRLSSLYVRTYTTGDHTQHLELAEMTDLRISHIYMINDQLLPGCWVPTVDNVFEIKDSAPCPKLRCYLMVSMVSACRAGFGGDKAIGAPFVLGNAVASCRDQRN